MWWASRVCLAGRSSTAQAERAVPAMQGTQFQMVPGWARGQPAGRNQKMGSCHKEHQHAGTEEKKGTMEREKGQEPEERYVEEEGWKGWRTPACSCKHKQNVLHIYLGEKIRKKQWHMPFLPEWRSENLSWYLLP